MTYVQTNRSTNAAHTYETIKADQGYYIVSVVVDPEEELGYYLTEVPIVAWLIESTIWHNGESFSKSNPVTLCSSPNSKLEEMDEQRIGIKHPNGLIYLGRTDNGITMEELIECAHMKQAFRRAREVAQQANAHAWLKV